MSSVLHAITAPTIADLLAFLSAINTDNGTDLTLSIADDGSFVLRDLDGKAEEGDSVSDRVKEWMISERRRVVRDYAEADEAFRTAQRRRANLHKRLRDMGIEPDSISWPDPFH